MSRSSEIDNLNLIVRICPFGCNGKCARIWINQITGHKIICICKCRHKIKQVLEVVEPDTNTSHSTSFPEREHSEI